MKSVLIYYGYPSSFNYSANGWNPANVITDIGSHYDVVVFGSGLENPAHPDHANTHTIINGLKASYSTKIFGYVTVAQSLQDFQSKCDAWDDMAPHGIFMDESGYDFGKTRSEFNDRVDYIHGLDNANICFANAWNTDNILGIEEDASYPNSTYNSGEDASNLASTDYCLLENLCVLDSTYESLSQCYARANKAKLLESTFGPKMIAASVLANNDGDAQAKFNNLYYNAHVWKLEGVGSSDSYFASGSATVTFWTRPSVTHL